MGWREERMMGDLQERIDAAWEKLRREAWERLQEEHYEDMRRKASGMPPRDKRREGKG